jgi:FlaA1/EpsC-like NDP-sugar epimerase
VPDLKKFVYMRLLLVYSVEAAAIAVAATAAFFLRFDFSISDHWEKVLRIGLMVWLPAKLFCFRLFGLDQRWARYVSIPDLIRLIASNIAGSCVSLIALIAIASGVPRTVYALDLLLCICITATLRVSVRIVAESLRPGTRNRSGTRTLIYGAGDAGVALLRDLRHNPGLKYDVRGFIDDDAHKTGAVLHGARVLGTGADLADMALAQRIDSVLIAIPSATGAQMAKILERCNACEIRYKTIPGLTELIHDDGLARQIRDVAVEDLLGRVPVSLDQERISNKLRGRVALVTGAAGSIGSEICRQIARFGPKAIIGFEMAESAVFHLEQEMTRQFPDTTFHAEIGSIQNRMRLNDIFEKHHPSVVYHAAAYKHVPLMEAHLFEAVENNVFGTLNVVEAARDYGAEEFVMISSDKAVRPANIMGLTKRIAELVVRSAQPGAGVFVSVRFGNVLGSNGSVVPVFKQQIARGGPVTVTHPEMRRYFMTIPEACQLVLQASTMGRGSEIFVLDMGEPVKIVDLARNLIMLSGLKPGRDIRIEFSQPRPGEKLYEEVNEEAEGLLTTHHEKIRVFAGAARPWVEMEWLLGRLRASCRERNREDVLAVARELAPEYEPSREVVFARASNGARPFEAETRGTAVV